MPLNIPTTSAPSLAESPDPSDDGYATLIVEHLDYIEKQCRKAVLVRPGTRNSLAPGWMDAADDGDNAAQELMNEVLDRLRANDYSALRRFQGRAKLTTYITTIIANLVVDLARSRHGRNRSRDRARELGPMAEQLYELVATRGYSLDAAREQLQATTGFHGSTADADNLLQRIRGREYGKSVIAEEGSWPAKGSLVLSAEGADVVVRDPTPSAEAQLVTRERQSRIAQALQTTLQGLDGEERLLLRLRFPEGEECAGKSFAEIATLLGLTAKAVDNRLRRIILRCRETMLQAGVSRDDLHPD